MGSLIAMTFTVVQFSLIVVFYIVEEFPIDYYNSIYKQNILKKHKKWRWENVLYGFV